MHPAIIKTLHGEAGALGSCGPLHSVRPQLGRLALFTAILFALLSFSCRAECAFKSHRIAARKTQIRPARDDRTQGCFMELRDARP